MQLFIVKNENTRHTFELYFIMNLQLRMSLYNVLINLFKKKNYQTMKSKI